METIALFVSAAVIVILFTIIILQCKRIVLLLKKTETDPFTHLLNYQGFCKMLQKRIEANSSFSIAIIDIDNFRKFNLHSYKLGDEVLKEFCVNLKEFLPEQTLVGRFRMGDEFVIAFENMDIGKTKEVLTRIKLQFENYNFVSLKEFTSAHVTFSEGIAQKSTTLNCLDDLFAAAEKELKRQKGEQ